MWRSPFPRALFLGASALLVACALSHDMAPAPACGSGMASGIDWWGPSDPSDRAALDDRCRTVGDPVVVFSPAPGFEAPAPGDSLAIFSWNVAAGGGDLLSFVREQVGITCSGPGSQPGPRMRHVILLLQEAHRRSESLPRLDDPSLAGTPSRSDGTPDVAEVAAHCGLAVAYVPSGRNDRSGRPRMDKGNAILSTLPLHSVAAVEAPYETERKVVLAAIVPLPTGPPLRVISAHLDVTTTFRRTLLSGNQTRTRQARGVLEALDSLERSDTVALPTLLAGDFNAWSRFDSALRLFRAALPDSPEWDGRPTRGPFPTDHVFFRKGAGTEVAVVADTYRRIDARYGSDHEPIFVWLSLGSATPSQ